MNVQVDDLLRLLLALLLGGAVGLERELRGKAAGLRTLMFIAGGSALLTIYSIKLAALPGAASGNDPARIAAQIVTGIGFLGAGVIMRDHGEIHGLTTASTIWLVAAFGIGAGMGQYLYSILAAAVIMLVLLVFPMVEDRLGRLTQMRSYTISLPASQEGHHYLNRIFHAHAVKIIACRRSRAGDEMTCKITAYGRPRSHEALVDELLVDSQVKGFDI